MCSEMTGLLFVTLFQPKEKSGRWGCWMVKAGNQYRNVLIIIFIDFLLQFQIVPPLPKLLGIYINIFLLSCLQLARRCIVQLCVQTGTREEGTERLRLA